MIYDYFVTYTVNDKMDRINFPNFHSMMNFVIDLVKNYSEYEIIIQDSKGRVIFKYVEIERES